MEEDPHAIISSMQNSMWKGKTFKHSSLYHSSKHGAIDMMLEAEEDDD